MRARRTKHLAYIGGPGGVLAGLMASFCEYAIQDALPPHSTLLAFTSTKQAFSVTVDQETSPILEARGRTRWFEGPVLRMRIRIYAQCKAPYSRIRRYSRSQATIRRIQSRWKKLLRKYWRARGHTRRFERPILLIRNARQSGAVSHSAQVSKHQRGVNLSADST